MLFFEEFCSKLNIDWADLANNDLFTETELARWLTSGKDESVARHPWPFTESSRDILAVAGQEEYDYPTNFLKSDSIRYLTVNGKRYEKLIFEDYLRYREDYSSGSKKFFSDMGRTLYINCLAEGFSNSIVCYGQVEVTGSVDSASTSTVFTVVEPEGDEAIIKLAYSRALASEKMKNPTKARMERMEAFEILDGIWQRILEKQHTYKTRDRPLFKRLNVLEGGIEEEPRSLHQF